jgi:hypothetical protein
MRRSTVLLAVVALLAATLAMMGSAAANGDQVPTGAITSPNDGQILLVGDTLDLGATYYDDDPSGVQWAVREGTCAANTSTVAGNVDSFSTPFAWDGMSFSSAIDTTGWAQGDYCFIFNPRETGNEPNMRLTRWFRIADGKISGGGQIIEPYGNKPKDDYKISFGGHLYRFGTDAPVCEWQVNIHNVSVNELDKGQFHGTTCTVPGQFNPGASDGVTNFAVYGMWNGTPGYTMVIRMEDNTEPGNLDTIRFELLIDPTQTATPNNSLGQPAVYDTSDKKPAVHAFGGDFPSISTNNGNARTEIDHGNLQI